MPRSIKISLKIPAPAPTRHSLLITLKGHTEVPPAISDELPDLLVLSDDQCDFNKLYGRLRCYGIIDNRFQWTFGDRHLVVMGNPLHQDDEQQAECLWLIYSLEEKARKKGGHVHYLPALQSLANTAWAYNQPNYVRNEYMAYSLYVALYDGNRELLRWLKTKKHISKIGDLLFANEFMENHAIYISNAIKTDNGINEDIVHQALQQFNAEVIITTTQLEEEGVQTYFNRELITVNTTESSAVLLIRKQQFYRLKTDGKKEKIGAPLLKE